MKQTCTTFLCNVEILSAQLISFFKVAATRKASDGYSKSPPTVSTPKAASSKLDGDLYQPKSPGLPISSSQVSSQLAC